MSDSRLKPSTEYLEAYLDTTPYLVETLQVYDIDREIYWYPSVMNLGSKGIVFPIDDDSEYKWKACKFIDSNKDGYEKELDVENGKEFDKYDFVETLKFLNITVNIDNGQNTN
ncbi:MAG: hypothetical protein H8E03_01035 [Pelagibacteraceae bacterium]|nr:hypothetical protein [Pelagibacteraceae bacterium]